MNYVKNEATGGMVRVGSRKYKELYPEAKKPVGRPSKKERLDPITDCMNLFKELGEKADEERVDEAPGKFVTGDPDLKW